MRTFQGKISTIQYKTKVDKFVCTNISQIRCYFSEQIAKFCIKLQAEINRDKFSGVKNCAYENLIIN